MTLEEIRPLLVAALIVLASVSMVRSNLLSSAKHPVRIPVRFESKKSPRRAEVS